MWGFLRPAVTAIIADYPWDLAGPPALFYSLTRLRAELCPSTTLIIHCTWWNLRLDSKTMSCLTGLVIFTNAINTLKVLYFTIYVIVLRDKNGYSWHIFNHFAIDFLIVIVSKIQIPNSNFKIHYWPFPVQQYLH